MDDSDTCLRQTPLKTERIVRRNNASNRAVQINAPLEEDLWKNVDRLVIEDNMADSQGIQVNYAITREMVVVMFDQQNKLIAAERQTPGVLRHDRVVVKASVR